MTTPTPDRDGPVTPGGEPGEISWGEPSGGLGLGIAGSGPGVLLALENLGPRTLQVMSHVAAGEAHLDWFRVRLSAGGGPEREIVLAGARDRSVPIRAELAPGERIEHLVDLRAWAEREVNGSRPIEPGSYTADAIYEVDPSEAHDDLWTGRLTSGSVLLRFDEPAGASSEGSP